MSVGTLHEDRGDEHADLTSHDTFVRAVPHATFARLRREEPVAWVEEGDEYAVRFAKSADQALGNVEEQDWEYFSADSSSLMLWAAGIGDTLGYSAPVLAALVEPQRAAAYRRLEDGFAGISYYVYDEMGPYWDVVAGFSFSQPEPELSAPVGTATTVTSPRPKPGPATLAERYRYLLGGIY